MSQGKGDKRGAAGGEWSAVSWLGSLLWVSLAVEGKGGSGGRNGWPCFGWAPLL